MMMKFLGCTDSSACNYDPNATYDDGSCIEQDYASVSSLHSTSNATSWSGAKGQSFNLGNDSGYLTRIRTNAIGGVSGSQLTNGV